MVDKVPVMNVEQFAVARRLKTTADVDGHIHAGLRSKPTTKTYARWFDRTYRELAAERDQTEAAYEAAILAGEVQRPAPPTLEERAQGEGPAAEASRRLLAKRAARAAEQQAAP